MREMLRILIVGLVLGVPAAIGLTKYLESQLYGVQAYDQWVIFSAVVVLALTAAAAAYLPARRATQIDPLIALRYE